MKKHSFLSIFLLLALALVSNPMWAESRLPHQPVGTDGYYIVKWDCEKNTWAESNDMEYDETFVLAIDLTGTPYENWVKNAQNRNGVNYPVDNTIVSLNTFLGDKGNMYTDNRARLWHIRDNIYGAMYNFAQFNMNNGQPNPTPAIGAQTKIYTRIFQSATLFSDHCYPIEPSASHKKGSVWDYQDIWFSKTDNQPFFVFAPYTGTKTGAEFSTEEMTPGTHIFYDNNHYVVSNGYAAPCSVNDEECCPFFYPLDPVTQTVPVGADTTLVAEERSGNLTGVQYQWYRYKTSDGESTAVPYTGTGAQSKTCHPATDVDGTDYTYYCFITTDNCPDGVYTTKAQVIVQNPCPHYTWTIDGVEGLEKTPMYPGGYYDICCLCTAGKPAVTITGNNIQTIPLSSGGNVTKLRVTLSGNASGNITFKATHAATTEYKSCDDIHEIPVGNCENGLAYTMQGFGGSGKYVIADDGKVILGTAVTDKTDMWQPIATGEQVNGNDVFYLRNVGTGEYLYRGPVQDTRNDNIDFAEPLTSPQNGMTADYKWFFHREGGDKRYIYLMNVAGWTGNWQNSFALHNRGWADKYCNGGNEPKYELRICDPEMKVGELTNYSGSNEMRMENDPYNTNNWQLKEVYGAPEHFQATISWSAPDIVDATVGRTYNYPATRSDAYHSINTISYSSSDPTVATVDANGKVTVIKAGKATITAKLDSVGCFDGMELQYDVMVQKCPTVTGAYPNLSYRTNAVPWDMVAVVSNPADTAGLHPTVQWYRYPYGGSKASAVAFNGYKNDGSGQTFACNPETSESGSHYNYYCVVKTDLCPTGAESIEWNVLIQDACQISASNLSVTATKSEYESGEDISVTASLNVWIGGIKQFIWHTPTGDIVDSTAAHRIITDNYQYSTLIIPSCAKANAGNYTCTVVEVKDECEFTSSAVNVKITGDCPASYNWTVDGKPLDKTAMYPGGWYDVVCSTPEGDMAPTGMSITGSGISHTEPEISGNSISARVTLQGNADGAITFTVNVGAKCSNQLTTTVAECTETSAESRKIEWFNFNGSTPFPQYWIHGGASVFLRDNNGVLEADIEHQDGNDQWYIIYTGEMCQGQKVFYLQNVQTMRYVYRGSVHGNQGGDWEYAEALLSETNLQTDDYKWVLYAHGNDTAIVNISGFTGSNLTNGAYVLHVRNWEAPGLFSNPNIPSPRMVCGKMADQGGSPAFYFKGYTTTKPITQFQTSVAWQGTAPTDTITSQQGNQFGYTISRTDQLHSINTAITYRSTNTSVATVDATGQVTVVAADGECDIEAFLETVGCFNGDTLRYHVRLYDCTRDIVTHNDYLLPKQPKADDCSYIVKWDCATGTWASENDMEWGETFVFAINLAGTPLGDWVMQGSGRAGVVRSVAFDRFQGKHDPAVDNIGQQLNLDASRLWHIRDTIFGATFNFSQIPFNDSPTHFYTPATGEQTEISARLFGFETAVGSACEQPGAAAAGKWWEWSNVGSTQSQWHGQWVENSYVSGNDMYLFRFAPYTGKSDHEIKAADDDSRDQWYDGHYFDRTGYHSPCPQAWPIDQTLSLDKTTICDQDGETAILTMATSEMDCSYQLYKDGTAIGGTQAGTGSALTWTITEAGTYTIMAISPIEGHDAQMGLCNGTKEQVLDVQCDLPTYLKFDDNNGTHVWSDMKNWWPTYTRLPNDTDSAVIAMPCQVDIPTARTYYLTFEVTSGYDITVLPTGGLTITGEITNAQQGDILIKSDPTGNGSFVYKNPATPYPAKVEFYSPAKDGDKLNPTWQYVGQPLAENIHYGATYTQPGTQIYIWDAQSDHSMGGLWYKVESAYNFTPFRGYCLTQAAPTTYLYQGNLNAATAQTLAVPYLDATDYPSFYLLSNSWTAPIRIADLETADFNDVDATVYIMNTGTYQEAMAQQPNQSATGQAKQKGQYNAIPVHAAPYMEDALQVIPSMQGFFVHNSTGNQAGSVTLDYEKAVYSTAYALSNEPARAPRRMSSNDAIHALHLTVENLYWADDVDILDGAQFTDGFDQGWDGRKMPGKDVNISLSVRTAGGEMSVAAMSDWTMVPLTLHSVRSLEYTFRATMQQESDLYLYDRDNNTYTALTDGAEYTFRTNNNIESERFYICKGWQKVSEETENTDGKYIINGHLIIIRNGMMHTALGMQLK